jgi:cytoskeletal protein CcmA (bactofilin family)
MTLRSGRAAAGALLVLGFILAGGAAAQTTELRGKLRSGDEVVVPASEVVEGDLYASGGTIRVEGRVEGDVVAAGGEIEVPGTVQGDVMAAGGRVSISGEVGGDVRAAGGELRLSGSAGEDVLVASGRLSVSSNGRIGEDLIFAAGEARLDGGVTGDVRGSAGDYSRGGTVGGGERVTERMEEEDEPSVADRLREVVRHYVSLLLIGALIVLLAPRVLSSAADRLRGSPLRALGLGILALLAPLLVVVGLILAALLLGVPAVILGLGGLAGVLLAAALLVALAVALLYVILIAFLADAVVGTFLGRLGLRNGDTRWRLLAALALGGALVAILIALPLIGGLIKLLVVIAGIGALVVAAWGRVRASSAPA